MTNPLTTSQIGPDQVMYLNSDCDLQALMKNAYIEISVRAIPGSCHEEFIALYELKEKLKFKLISTAVVVVLKHRYDENSHYSLDQLSLLLKPVLLVVSNEIKKELRSLVSQKVVERYSRDGITYYRLSESAKNALEDSDVEHFWESLPIGVERILNYCKDELFNFSKVSSRRMFEFYHEVEDLNSELSLIKFIHEYELYTNVSELYTFFGIVLKSFDASDAFRFYSTEEYMECSMVEKMALKMLIVEGEWVLIRKGFVEVTQQFDHNYKYSCKQ
jgi:hypothetical protein